MSLLPLSLPTPAPTPTPTPTATTATTPVPSAESSPPPLSLPQLSAAGSAVQPPTIHFYPATPSADTPVIHPSDYGFRDSGLPQEVSPIGIHSHNHQFPQYSQASGHGSQTMLSVENANISIPTGNKSCILPSPSSGPAGRKQRFTMGPRVDCVKCRMGVKGHWVHLD